ncbi:MAG: substrate-binding domain-containing protein [Marinilabiliaceae bacterium]
MKISRAIFFLAIPFMIAAPSGCNGNADEQKQPYELVIYCENGILKPIREITNSYETATGLNIRIRNDCARNLVSFLHYRDEADIFIPDAAETLTSILQVDSLFFSDLVYLGHQSLVFFVQNGNPEQFDGHLSNLFEPENGMVLANPESSTLGLLSGMMLKENLMYEDAINSVLFLTIDSRNLAQTVVKKQASLAIGWKSDYSEALSHQIDTVHIKGASPGAVHHKASAALLQSAPHEEEARRYLKLLTSAFATRIFEKYEIMKDSISGI